MKKVSEEQLQFLWDQVRDRNGDIWHPGELETGKQVFLRRTFRRGIDYIGFKFQIPVTPGSDVMRTRSFSINTKTRVIKET